MIKIDYQKIAENLVSKLESTDEKPRILVHTCCGPCVIAALLFLMPYFQVTVYFNNSNIYPKAEYDLRLSELRRILETFEEFKDANIELVITPYNNEDYTKKYLLFGKDEKEGGTRCRRCYMVRMEEAYDFAEKNGFDYFVTAMTFSRQKNSQVINQIGDELEKKHAKTKYFYSDFKKHGGQIEGGKLIKKYQLYCQDYCGCAFSFDERDCRKGV